MEVRIEFPQSPGKPALSIVASGHTSAFIEKISRIAGLERTSHIGLLRTFSGPKDGIFYKKHPHGHWLNEADTLEQYNLQKNEVIQFRSKLRLLKVSLADNSLKQAHLDESKSVAELIELFCAMAGCQPFHQEFGLKLRSDQHNPNNWLDPEQTLRDQNCSMEDTILLSLRKRFFCFDRELSISDLGTISLTYAQVKESLISGHFSSELTIEDSIVLGAQQLSIENGPYVEQLHSESTIKLDKLVCPEHRKRPHLVSEILREYQSLTFVNAAQAKLQFILLCSRFKTYGISFFTSCREKHVTSPSSTHSIVLGINRQGILRFSTEKKDLLSIFPLEWINSAVVTNGNLVTIDFHPELIDALYGSSEVPPTSSYYINSSLTSASDILHYISKEARKYAIQLSDADKFETLLKGYIHVLSTPRSFSSALLSSLSSSSSSNSKSKSRSPSPSPSPLSVTPLPQSSSSSSDSLIESSLLLPVPGRDRSRTFAGNSSSSSSATLLPRAFTSPSANIISLSIPPAISQAPVVVEPIDVAMIVSRSLEWMKSDPLIEEKARKELMDMEKQMVALSVAAPSHIQRGEGTVSLEEKPSFQGKSAEELAVECEALWKLAKKLGEENAKLSAQLEEHKKISEASSLSKVS